MEERQPSDFELRSAAAVAEPTDTGSAAGAPVARLASTGIPALDARLGGLVRGRHYLLDGAPGAGKSSAALHFLGYGLEAGERGLILTQDDPADVLAQADYLGYDFRAAAEREQLVVLQYRLDFPRNFARAADPSLALDELSGYLAKHRPDRLVIDSLSPFLESGRASEEALAGFPEFLESAACTTYITVPGDVGDSAFSRIYDRVIAGAAGIFHIEIGDGPVRALTIRKLRQPVKSTEPLRFVLRPGVGIVEHEAARHSDGLPDELRRRIVLLHARGGLPEELDLALDTPFDVVRYDSVEGALAELVAARHGAIIIALDPRDSERVFHLTRELRRAGNGAPILYVSPSHGLRGSTRARGLRAGGDDFLTDALSPDEFLERIEVAIARGHRRPGAEAELEPLHLQPVAPDGSFVLMKAEEFRQVLRTKMERTANPFFALLVLRPDNLDIVGAWEALCASLRMKEGDLGAALPDGGLAVYLHDVRRRHVDQLLQRITTAHPGLGSPNRIDILCYPTDQTEIRQWLEAPALTEPAGR